MVVEVCTPCSGRCVGGQEGLLVLLAKGRAAIGREVRCS
jgi:hypothetical protein